MRKVRIVRTELLCVEVPDDWRPQNQQQLSTAVNGFPVVKTEGVRYEFKPTIHFEKRNGVIMQVDDFDRIVDSTCKCFGYDMRAHSTADCPNRGR